MSETLEEMRARFRVELANSSTDQDLRSAPVRGESMVVSIRIRPEDYIKLVGKARDMAMTPAEMVRYLVRKGLGG